MTASEPSPLATPCSLNVPLSELDREPPGSVSLGLFVLAGFVLGELAGEAVTGGPRGCWCIVMGSSSTVETVLCDS